MLQLLVTSPDFEDDQAAKTVSAWLLEEFRDDEGSGYYRHPAVTATTGTIPDFTILTRSNQPLAVRCLPWDLAEIEECGPEIWIVNGIQIDSPTLEIEDFVFGLKSRFDKDRLLRRRIHPKAVLALPLIGQRAFESKFGDVFSDARTIWQAGNTEDIRFPLDPILSDTEWQLTRAVFQGITPLNKPAQATRIPITSLATTIKELDRRIALLDEEQEKGALQVAPGPQRIRGLAGTGKTVLLAMKAANIHLRYPNKKILFTFNTQSLYNQAKTLISKFYRFYSDTDPNWECLHIRHGWGGRNRPGVYYDLSARQGVTPLTFRDARQSDFSMPFQYCCRTALRFPIEPEYDFILVDEAQDFPKEFFHILYRLTDPPHQIYWAYDELQRLSSIETPKLEDQFGVTNAGRPLVSLDGDDYPGQIEKDLVLHRSYRCPQSILMLAHAIGLGLYNPRGCIQMLASEDSWRSIGYEIESGELRTGKEVTIYRPPKNSPNPVYDLYQGQPLIKAIPFSDRTSELEWIAQSIREDITKEGVAAEQIVVIPLDVARMRPALIDLQRRLQELHVASTIPGLIDDSAAFAEEGRVTLSSVFRAKGNEAYIVYIFGFESLRDYVQEIESRNKAFAAITRSKAWVRITGVGQAMDDVKTEIDAILANLPRFRFTFPDLSTLRRLDAETSRRRREVNRAKDSLAGLLTVDPKALDAALTPEQRRRLRKLLDEASGEDY